MRRLSVSRELSFRHHVVTFEKKKKTDALLKPQKPSRLFGKFRGKAAKNGFFIIVSVQRLRAVIYESSLQTCMICAESRPLPRREHRYR